MKVLKFGGTSVGTVDSLANVKRIVDSLDEPAIVVVSALGGLTDRLIATAKLAADNDPGYRESMRQMSQRHQDIIDAVVPADRRADVRRNVSEYLSRLEDIYTGLSLIGMLPDKVLNRIVSFGERMSSIIVAAMLENADHADPLEFMKTEKWYGRDIAARDITDELIARTFTLPLKHTVVTGGFISRDKNTGEITNLGRGGSDYTAALIAAALNADILEIWTDVDGFMTADPRIIPEAAVIDKMSYTESMELCSFGAKVIYPPTIYPVFHKNIPIKILNTFHPDAPGTLIADTIAGKDSYVRGTSVLRNVSMISISLADSADVNDFNSRILNALAKHGINVILATTAPNRREISVVITDADSRSGFNAVTEEFAPEVSNGLAREILRISDLSVVAVVRESIKKIDGLGRRLFETLSAADIDILTVSNGISETTIAFVVKSANANRCLKVIHDTCFDTGLTPNC